MTPPRTCATLLLVVAASAVHLSHSQIHWNRGWGAGGTLGKRSYSRFHPHPWSTPPSSEWGGLVEVRHLRQTESAPLRPLDKLAERYSHTADRKLEKYPEDAGSPLQSYPSEPGVVSEASAAGDGNQRDDKSTNERTPIGKGVLELSSVMLEGQEAESCSVDAVAISALLAQLVHAEALRVIECRTSTVELGRQHAQGAEQ